MVDPVRRPAPARLTGTGGQHEPSRRGQAERHDGPRPSAGRRCSGRLGLRPRRPPAAARDGRADRPGHPAVLAGAGRRRPAVRPHRHHQLRGTRERWQSRRAAGNCAPRRTRRSWTPESSSSSTGGSRTAPGSTRWTCSTPACRPRRRLLRLRTPDARDQSSIPGGRTRLTCASPQRHNRARADGGSARAGVAAYAALVRCNYACRSGWTPSCPVAGGCSDAARGSSAVRARVSDGGGPVPGPGSPAHEQVQRARRPRRTTEADRACSLPASSRVPPSRPGWSRSSVGRGVGTRGRCANADWTGVGAPPRDGCVVEVLPRHDGSNCCQDPFLVVHGQRGRHVVGQVR